ncbi:uncharacterized protein [Dysidea avara]|uniref:uncharacterized protein isoform X2 n=1 Tax=Dysidea avara TaxID=196820 RepID=UPI00331938BA
MSTKAWKTRMCQISSSYVSKTSVSCGITLIVLHAIAWPSLAVWIALDVVLVALLILQQLTKKPPEPLKIVMPVKGNNNKRGGFVDAMAELTQKKQSGGRGRTRTHSKSRPVKKYSHDYSRCTPDDRYIKTPRLATAVVRNRLSYSAAESSFGTSFGLRSTTATPNPFSPIAATTNMVQGGSTLSSSPWHHGHTPHDAKTSSVLRIARSNLPATMEVHSPIMASPAAVNPREVVGAKSQSTTPSKDSVVNALKQISQKRKRVHPLASDQEDSKFLDSLPSVKRIRKEPKHQAVKRTWTKVINTESFNQPSMPDTKKHKKTVNVIEKEISPPTSAPEIMSVVSHKDTEQPVETEEIPSSSNKPVAEPIEELEQNISDKENVSVDQPPEQEKIKQFGVLKKMRTIYPSSKPSVDALRRKFPVLCSSGVAPKLVRQSSQVKYEDYVKDREDVYAKVKRVLEEEEEKDEVKKKKDEGSTIVSTSSNAPSTSGLSTAISSTVPPNVTISLAAQTVPSSIIIPTAVVTSASSTAPPLNVVISSSAQVTSASTNVLQSSTVLPNLTLFNPTSKSSEAAPSSTVLPSVLPTVISQNSTAGVTSASQKFSFSLPTAQPQPSTSSIQLSSISLPSITTTTSSIVTLSGVGPGPLLPPTSTSTSSTVLPQFNFLAKTTASQVGPSLQLPSTSTNTSSTMQQQFNFLAKATANQGESSLQLPSSLSSTMQPQFNFLAKTTASLVGTSSLFDASTNRAAPILGLTSSTSSSSILPSFNKPLTTANTSAKSPGLDADGGMEIAAPQANTSFGTLFSNTSNTITSSNTTNGSFAGLFTASVAPTNNPLTATSSSAASNFGNLFSQSTTTAITTSSSHAFSFNLNQSAQTTKPPQLGNQLQQNPSKNVPTFNFGLPVSTTGAAQSNQPTINFGLPTSGTSLTSQPQTQSNTGFNFMANTNTSTAGFSFNLQPSLGNTGANLFSAPPGGLNLPPTPAQPVRRKPKTPSRGKTRKK